MASASTKLEVLVTIKRTTARRALRSAPSQFQVRRSPYDIGRYFFLVLLILFCGHRICDGQRSCLGYLFDGTLHEVLGELDLY